MGRLFYFNTACNGRLTRHKRFIIQRLRSSFVAETLSAHCGQGGKKENKAVPFVFFYAANVN